MFRLPLSHGLDMPLLFDQASHHRCYRIRCDNPEILLPSCATFLFDFLVTQRELSMLYIFVPVQRIAIPESKEEYTIKY